jgi:hypothetical protein
MTPAGARLDEEAGLLSTIAPVDQRRDGWARKGIARVGEDLDTAQRNGVLLPQPLPERNVRLRQLPCFWLLFARTTGSLCLSAHVAACCRSIKPPQETFARKQLRSDHGFCIDAGVDLHTPQAHLDPVGCCHFCDTRWLGEPHGRPPCNFRRSERRLCRDRRRSLRRILCPEPAGPMDSQYSSHSVPF